MYARVYYRLIALLALPGLLSGCSVYDHFFHPHRLGTPPMTSSAKAKARAAEKARHKGLTLGTTEAAGSPDPGAGSADGAAPTPAADTRSADDKNKAIAEMLGNTYDTKTGLLKRSKLQRLDYRSHALHHYDLRPNTHNQVNHDARKLRKYTRHPKDPGATPAAEPAAARPAKRGPRPAPDPTQPAAPAPAAQPRKATTKPAAKPKPAATPASAAPRSNPDKLPVEKKRKKDRKEPKPDPTQPHDGPQ